MWYERSYAHVLGGLILGRAPLFVGLLLLIAAVMVHLVFKK